MAWTQARGAAGLFCLLLAGACSGPPKPSADQPTNQSVAADIKPVVAPLAPSASAAKAFKLEDRTPALDFAYAYPMQAAAIPALASTLAERMDKTKADALKAAKDDEASAKQAGYPFRQHSLQTTWAIHADTPRFLSLLGETYVYSGGAHGMTAYAPLLWDRQAAKEVPITALMMSQAAFAKAISARFCDALDEERAKKRGAPVTRDAGEFSKCLDPMKQAIVPEAGKDGVVSLIRVVIGPYEAGPYAEGSYDIAVPVDAGVLGAIKPEYRGSFAGGR